MNPLYNYSDNAVGRCPSAAEPVVQLLKSAPRLHARRRLGGVEPSAWIWGEVRKSVAPTALFMARFRWDTAKLCLVGICSESSASLSPSSSLRVR